MKKENFTYVIPCNFDEGSKAGFRYESDAIVWCIQELEKYIPDFDADKIQLRTVSASYTRFQGFDEYGKEAYESLIKGQVTLIYIKVTETEIG